MAAPSDNRRHLPLHHQVGNHNQQPQGRPESRGLKRPRRPSPTQGLSGSSGSENGNGSPPDMVYMDDDEVDVPLSKRINRLNIEKELVPATAAAHSNPPPLPLPGPIPGGYVPVVNHASGSASGTGPVDPHSGMSEANGSEFDKLYPYGPDSPYFKSNQLLRDLYFQREHRRQRLEGTSLSPKDF